MPIVPTVRTFQSREWRSYRDLRLRALADAPDAFGSTLAAEQMREESEWSMRLARGIESGLDLPLVAEVNQVAVGLAWAKVDASNPALANLYQMWVDPKFRRSGVGRMLLRAAIDWARGQNVQTVVLGVTCGDTPAMRLYLQAGFRPVGATEPLRLGSHLLAQSMSLSLNGPAA